MIKILNFGSGGGISFGIIFEYFLEFIKYIFFECLGKIRVVFKIIRMISCEKFLI